MSVGSRIKELRESKGMSRIWKGPFFGVFEVLCGIFVVSSSAKM
jgi:transcriptional regulator with XRE-family HTH domain